MKLTRQLRSEILDVYEAFWGSLFNVDIELYTQVIDDNYRLIGTTEDEMFFNKQDAISFLKATGDQLAGNIERRKSKIKIEPVDSLALITEQFDAYVLIENDWTFYGKTRVSTWMQQKPGGWKLIQQHFSLPDTKAEEGQTIGLEKITKENLELREAVKRRTIELAEKNRELEIEAALERVRARTMAMQKSAELKEAAALLFQQVKALGAPAYSCGYNIWEEGEKSFTSWMSSQDGSDFNAVLNIPLTEDANFIRFDESRKKGEQFFVLELRGKRMQEHYRYLKTIPAFKAYFDYAVSVGFDLPATQIHHVANFSNGNLLFITLEPCPEFHDVFKRFATVFDQTYTRFLDLQKAEAQAREAQIELGLERVRARAMAMQRSDELKELIATVSLELSKLDFVLDRCFITVIDAQSLGMTWWMANPETSADPMGLSVKYHEHIPYLAHLEAWKERKVKWVYVLEGDIKKTWDKFLFSETDFSKLPPIVIDDMRSKEKVFLSSSFNNFGYLSLATLEPLTDEQFDIMLRFAKVFDLTYTRFNDLQKAEAQAREAQIELGLERVRARAMAMQKSEELSELVDTVFKELTKLDFALTWCIINIINEPSLTNMVWAANPETNKPPESYLMKFEDYPFHHSMLKGYKERKTKYVYVMEGKEKKIYDEYLFNKTEWRRVPKEAQAASRAMKRYVATFTFSNFGGLQTVGEEHLSEENLDILSRFGKVFDLTYTRSNAVSIFASLVCASAFFKSLKRV